MFTIRELSILIEAVDTLSLEYGDAQDDERAELVRRLHEARERLVAERDSY